MQTDFDITPVRFRLKKIARRVSVTSGRLIRFLLPREHNCVRVLTYHRFSGSPYDPFALDTAIFEQQLQWLSTNATVLSPRQFEQFVSGGTVDIPRKSVLITIDDAHASVTRHALPALSRSAVKAVLFVCPALIDRDCGRTRSFMTWDELQRARQAGHEIAPHGLTHRSLGRMAFNEAVNEIETAREILERRLGVETPYFSFPFGTRLDYSERLLEHLRKLGYQICFSSQHGICTARNNNNLYPRLKIEGGPETDLFPHIARGCLDNWALVDSLLYCFQQRGRL